MKHLIVTLLVGLALVGCTTANNDDVVDDTARNTVDNNDDNNDNNDNYDDDMYNDNDNNDGMDNNGESAFNDTHYNYVTGLGFTDIVNPNNGSYNTRYTLNSDYANNDEIFHQWRHTWVDPEEYRDRDIDVYRYTGTLDGEQRHIHVLSHEGRVIGGFHHGENETVEDAIILERDTYSSRLADDFRTTWDDLFGINR